MTRAQSCINKRLSQLGIKADPRLMGDLQETIVGATGSYGCEIWSTSFLDDWHLRDCSLQRHHSAALKRSLGVRSSTGNHLIYFEAGRLPMVIGWLARVVGYWNKLVSNLANSNMLSEILKTNVHCGLVQGAKCWASELLAGLKFMAPTVVTDWHEHIASFKPIDKMAVKLAATTQFQMSIQHFNHDLTDPACPKRYHNIYNQWMHTPPEGEYAAPAYLSSTSSTRKAIHATAQIRLNNAPIRSNTDHNLDYARRVCTRCESNLIDHEAHFLLECSGLASIRAKDCYSELLSSCTTIQELMQAAYLPSSSPLLNSFMLDMMNHLHGLAGPSHRQ